MSSSDRERGFTLMESLVALAILAAGLAAIGQLGYSSLFAAQRTLSRLDLISAARAALTALPDRRAARNGVTEGDIFRDRWRLDSRPYPYVAPGGPLAPNWTPQLLKLTVTDPTGAKVIVETVRLRRAGS